MPVTPAHAAAAWPLRRVLPRLPLSALVIGTMSPDYEYFLRLAPISRWAHQPIGLIAFCVPVSLAVWFVFRRVVRPALVDLLPGGLQSAIGPPSTSWLLAVAAVAIGTVSHVVWDGFTHYNDWGIVVFPTLQHEVAPHVVPGLRWYKLLQHVSSVVGMAAIVTWAGVWLRSQPASTHRARSPPTG